MNSQYLIFIISYVISTHWLWIRIVSTIRVVCIVLPVMTGFEGQYSCYRNVPRNLVDYGDHRYSNCIIIDSTNELHVVFLQDNFAGRRQWIQSLKQAPLAYYSRCVPIHIIKIQQEPKFYYWGVNFLLLFCWIN